MPTDNEIRKGLKVAKKFAELDEIEITEAINKLFRQHEGRKFLWWLLETGRVNTQPFVGEKTHETAFGLGEMNVGLQIQARLIEVNPDGYMSMQKEHANESRKRSSALAPALADTGPEPESDA